MHGEIMIQYQGTKAAATWAMMGRVRSGLIDTWLVDKNKGSNYVVISLWLFPLWCLMSGLQLTVKNDLTSLLSRGVLYLLLSPGWGRMCNFTF